MSESTGIPVRAVHEASLKSVAAREEVAAADDPSADGSHRALQQAVGLYFDVLRPYLVGSDDGREYYHGQIPEGPTDEGTAVLETTMRQETFPRDAFQEPPSNANLKDRHNHLLQQVPTKENEIAADLQAQGDMVLILFQQHTTGLRHLEGLYSNRSTTVRHRDDWLPEAEPIEETRLELMDLDMLMRASRILDEAAHDLGFLPQEEDRPKNDFAAGD